MSDRNESVPREPSPRFDNDVQDYGHHDEVDLLGSV